MYYIKDCSPRKICGNPTFDNFMNDLDLCRSLLRIDNGICWPEVSTGVHYKILTLDRVLIDLILFEVTFDCVRSGLISGVITLICILVGTRLSRQVVKYGVGRICDLYLQATLHASYPNWGILTR